MTIITHMILFHLLVWKRNGIFWVGFFEIESDIFTLPRDEVFLCLFWAFVNYSQILLNSHQESHLLRQSKYWNWRVNLEHQYFVKLHLCFQCWPRLFDIFFWKKFHPSRVCLSNDMQPSADEPIQPTAAEL